MPKSVYNHNVKVGDCADMENQAAKKAASLQVLPTEEYFARVRQSLSEKGQAYVRVTGMSMWPLLHHLRDGVILIPPHEIRRGDIVLFARESGRYALHRVIEKKGEIFTMAGDSLVYYFYKDYCPYCAQLNPLMAGLPEKIILPDGTASPVKLIALNKNEPAAAEIIAAYYSNFDVPEDRRYVPAVVIGQRYLMPGSEIIDQLMDALVSGEGLLTPLLNGAQRLP